MTDNTTAQTPKSPHNKQLIFLLVLQLCPLDNLPQKANLSPKEKEIHQDASVDVFKAENVLSVEDND